MLEDFRVFRIGSETAGEICISGDVRPAESSTSLFDLEVPDELRISRKGFVAPETIGPLLKFAWLYLRNLSMLIIK